MFYVPVSVVMVAAAIQRVASVPLKKRALALEDHVLSQFGKSIQPCVSSSPPAATARAPGLLLLFVLLRLGGAEGPALIVIVMVMMLLLNVMMA